MGGDALIGSVVGMIGSLVAQRCADAAVQATWRQVRSAWKARFGREPRREDLSGEDLAVLLDSQPEIRRNITLALQSTPALRRAQLVRSILDGARVLWIDDHPENNQWECGTLQSLGIEVVCAQSTENALSILEGAGRDFDCILSDIRRGGRSDAGIVGLSDLRSKTAAPIVFYVGRVDPRLASPPGCFGITNRPDDLLHLVLDVLERARV